MKKFKDLMGHVRMEEAVKNDPCWKGYEMVGMKDKNGKKVPNCVPTKEEVEIDEAMSNDDKSSVALRALVAKKNLKNSEGKVKSVDFLVKMKNRVKAGKDLQKEEVEQLEEGRPSQRHPLEGHEYHRKSDAELVHIAKDAHKAAEAMKSHNTDAENKYRDQANDSATVRYYRQKHGMADWYKKKYGHIKEEAEQINELSDKTLTSYAQKVHDDSLKHDKDPSKRPAEKRNKSVMGFSRAINKLEARPQNEEVEKVDEVWSASSGKHPMDFKSSYSKGKEWDEGPSKHGTPVARQPKGEYERKVTSYLKKKYGKTNEEVEQLDEISSDTLNSYVKKANASIKSDIKSGKATNKTDDRHDNLMKAKQRLSGSAGGLRDRKYTAEGTEQVDEAMSASFRMALALKREKEKREEKDKAREARGDRFTTGPAQKPTPVQSHVTAESVNEQTASKLGQEREEVPFDKPYKTTKTNGTVTDKSGAVHTPMSRAKHLAKMAARKAGGIKEESEPDDSYQKNDTLAKRSLSKTAGMVKDLAKNAKTKKGSKADDKFEPEPELSSQIVKV